MRNHPPNTSKALSIVRSLLLFAALLLLTMPLYAAPSDLDPTWGGDGIVEVDFDGNGEGYEFSIFTTTDSEGRMLTFGTAWKSEINQFGFGVIRYMPDGTRDSSFGLNGSVIHPGIFEYDSFTTGAAFQSDGKIIIAGVLFDNDDPNDLDTPTIHLVFLRLNLDGSLDTSFGVDGYSLQYPPILHEDEYVQRFLSNVAVDAQDRIILSGELPIWPLDSIRATYLVRLNSDGTLDTTFGANGFIRLEQFGFPLHLNIQPDGKLLLSGHLETDLPSDCPSMYAGLMRFDVNGQPDPSFGNGGQVAFSPGWVETSNQEEAAWIINAFLLADGKILTIGGMGNLCDSNEVVPYNFIARLNGDGSLDSTFAENGVVFIPSRSGYWGNLLDFRSAALQPNEQAVYTIDWGYDLNRDVIKLTRLHLDGTVDDTWEAVNLPIENINDYDPIMIEPRGKIILTNEDKIWRFLGEPALTYTGLSPLHRQKHIAPRANLSITFPDSVTINTGKIEIRRVSDFSLFESIDVTDSARVTGSDTNTITINPSVDFEPNTTYYVLVDPNTFVNASGHPFSGVRELTEWHFTTADSPVVTPPTNLIKNPGFEGKGGKATRPAKWTVNKLTSTDRRICNVERDGKPDLIYAHSGQCAFRFQSGVVKARNIQQEIGLVDAFADQTLNLSAFVRTNNLRSGAIVQVMLTYADDSKKTVNLNVPRGTKPYRKIQKSFVLPKDAASARVRIMTGTSKGTLLIDDLSLTVSEATALPMAIPVPAAPDLRGN